MRKGSNKKMTTALFRQHIERVGSEVNWRRMSLLDFEGRFVSVALQLSEERLAKVIQPLDEYTFSCWTKKLWEEQDIPADQNGYAKSLNMLRVLKKSLIVRLMCEEDHGKRLKLQQQLALLSLILDPAGFAEKTGMALGEAV